jgi:hypothetical protein
MSIGTRSVRDTQITGASEYAIYKLENELSPDDHIVPTVGWSAVKPKSLLPRKMVFLLVATALAPIAVA